ncbi:hypothetical protein GCM10009733_059850 [Nonomuraea maheshkhaliensis]|uniref:2TM domain-containing protein n=1 Tax=Nonomuraea maheshkhaliensis TaxID=419590 RepID=A0ABP4RLJ3_9ACTN
MNGASSSAQREWARRQLEKKRRLRADITGYVVVNAFLVGVWALTGFGYFWPGWVIGGWGVLLVLAAWNTYADRPISEADIDRELQRHG